MFKTCESLNLKYLLLNPVKSHHNWNRRTTHSSTTPGSRIKLHYRVQWMTLSRNPTAIIHLPRIFESCSHWYSLKMRTSSKQGPYDHSMIDLFDRQHNGWVETRTLTQDSSLNVRRSSSSKLLYPKNSTHFYKYVEETYFLSHWLVFLRLFYVSCKRGC